MIRRSFFLLVAVLLINGCNDLRSYVKTDIDIDFPINLAVIVDNPGMKSTPFPFDATMSIDLSGDEQLAEYLDNIHEITVTDISATVSDLDQSIVLTDVTLIISGNDQSVNWNFDNITITNGVTLELSNTNQEFDTLSAILSALSDIEVQFTGFSDTSGIEYTLEVILNTTVTVGL